MCDENRTEQNWKYDEQVKTKKQSSFDLNSFFLCQSSQLQNEYYKEQCLTVATDSNVVLSKKIFAFSFIFYVKIIVLAHCDTNNPGQKWTFNQEVKLFD